MTMAMRIHTLAVLTSVLAGLARASQVEVVIAHYNEDLAWASKIPKDAKIRIYTKGAQLGMHLASVPGAKIQQLPNVGRESHTYLKHIVDNFDNLAQWTVFTQAGEPSFGYKGHRSGGGHLLAGDDFAKYLLPDASGSRFVYTAVVHLPSTNHLLRAAYCINDERLEGGDAMTCPKEASQWSPWWDLGDFRKFLSSKVESQHGEGVIDFYRKYINPAFTGDEVIAFFSQGARFAVSRETIHRRPKSDYQKLLASLSHNEDPYAGYFMEWLWSELFLGHREPCQVPIRAPPVSHRRAMDTLVKRFPESIERQWSTARSLAGASATVSGGISGGNFLAKPSPAEVVVSSDELVKAEYVEIDLVIQSIDYGKLVADPAMREKFEMQVKDAIAHESGPAVTSDDIALKLSMSEGSVVVSASISLPETRSEAAVLHEVRDELSRSSNLQQMVAEHILGMQEVDAIATGNIVVSKGTASIKSKLVTVVEKDPMITNTSTTRTQSMRDFYEESSGAQEMSGPPLGLGCMLLGLLAVSAISQD